MGYPDEPVPSWDSNNSGQKADSAETHPHPNPYLLVILPKLGGRGHGREVTSCLREPPGLAELRLDTAALTLGLGADA